MLTRYELHRRREVAKAFHESYERLAPQFTWVTQEESRVAWDKLPERQRRLMEAVVGELFAQRVIRL